MGKAARQLGYGLRRRRDLIAAHALGIDSVGDMYVGKTLEGARILKYARVR